MRPAHLDGLRRAQEQADADTGAERHQADVSLTELALQGAVLNLLFADRRHGNNLILLLR